MLSHKSADERHLVFRAIRFAQDHSLLVLVAVAVVTLVLGYFALGTRIDPEVLRLLPEDAEVNRLIEKHGANVKDVDYVIVVLTSDDLFRADRLAAIESATRRIEALEPITGSVTPLNLPTFYRDGTRLTFVPLSRGGSAPDSEADVQSFRERILRDPLARNIVVSEDGSSFRLIFTIRVLKQYDGFLATLEPILVDLRKDFEVRLAGWVPLHEATRQYILRDPPKLIVVAVVVTFLIYLVGFGTARAVVLPLVTTSVSMVWTLGVMAILDVPLTVISIMIPPLIFALGSSYSIHVLNQYYHEAQSQGGGTVWIAPAVYHITRTVLLAAITEAVGFASLLSCTIPRLQEFGIFTSLGILLCALLALFLFPALLVRLPRPAPRQSRRVAEGYLTRMSVSIGRGVIRFHYPILAVVLVITVAFVFSLRDIRYQTDFTAYYRDKVDAVEDNRFLMRTFGSFVDVNLTLTAPEGRPGYFFEPEVLSRLDAFEKELKTDPNVSDVTSYVSYLKAMAFALTDRYEIPENRSMVLLFSRLLGAARTSAGQYVDSLVSRDFRSATFRIWVYNGDTKWFPFEETMKEATESIGASAARHLPAETTPEMWGWNLVALKLSEILMRDQFVSLTVSALVVFGITAVSFRSLRYGLLAAVPLTVGIMLNYVLLWILGIPFDVLTVMFSGIAVGVGVDNAIHLLILYRRFRAEAPGDPREALAQSLRLAGRPIVLTSSAVVLGLFALAFSSFTPVAYFGLLIALALATATAGSIIVLPAILSFVRPEANRDRVREG